MPRPQHAPDPTNGAQAAFGRALGSACCERMAEAFRSGYAQRPANIGIWLRLDRLGSIDTININHCPWCGQNVRDWPNTQVTDAGPVTPKSK